MLLKEVKVSVSRMSPICPTHRLSCYPPALQRLGSKRGDASEHEASRRVWGLVVESGVLRLLLLLLLLLLPAAAPPAAAALRIVNRLPIGPKVVPFWGFILRIL